jgi:hypothetical protein
MRTVARRLAVALLLVAVTAFAPGAQAYAAPSVQQVAHSAPVAIDIPSLFGDENEADENEPDEGAPQSSAQPAEHGSGVSLPVVAVLVALAAAFGAYVYVRIRRLYRRIVEWSRGMWARS